MTQKLSENGAVSPEKAKEALAADNKRRSDACQKEVQEVLNKHNCTMDIVTVLRNGQHPSHIVSVVAQ